MTDSRTVRMKADMKFHLFSFLLILSMVGCHSDTPTPASTTESLSQSAPTEPPTKEIYNSGGSEHLTTDDLTKYLCKEKPEWKDVGDDEFLFICSWVDKMTGEKGSLKILFSPFQNGYQAKDVMVNADRVIGANMIVIMDRWLSNVREIKNKK